MNGDRALLLLALDPSRVMLGRGLTPDPWQRRLLLDPGRQVLLNCSRQSGKSQTVAALAVHTAVFRPGSLILLVSPSLRQSTELFRKVLDGYQAIGRPIAARAATQTRLELANHSRVLCLPGKTPFVPLAALRCWRSTRRPACRTISIGRCGRCSPSRRAG